MNTLAGGLSYIDLQFQGVPRVIATVVVQGKGGVALIDPGPSSALPELRRGLELAGVRVADLTAILLTHIHLDHAGASGTLVRENPRLRVFVHQSGVRHLVDPARLLASAARLYGDDMDRLWGEFLPVPAAALVALAGGERVAAGGRDFEVAYTPGHASHHVSYFAADTRIAFVGDTAGIRLRPDGYVLPPTPPPDVDLEAWAESLARIDRWGADTVFMTHFGPSAPATPVLRELSDHMEMTRRLVHTSLGREGSDEERENWFRDEIRRELRRRMSETDAHAYEVAGRFDLSWRGMARYLRKRESQ